MDSGEKTRTIRACRVCEEPLHGRSDKQYCSDYCRAIQYNRLHAEDIRVLRRTHYILRNNRNILQRLHTQVGKRPVNKDQLVLTGFHTEFMTRRVQRNARQEEYYCYDYGYSIDGRDRVHIIPPDPDQAVF